MVIITIIYFCYLLLLLFRYRHYRHYFVIYYYLNIKSWLKFFSLLLNANKNVNGYFFFKQKWITFYGLRSYQFTLIYFCTFCLCLETFPETLENKINKRLLYKKKEDQATKNSIYPFFDPRIKKKTSYHMIWFNDYVVRCG
jgi:hypothetical protein